MQSCKIDIIVALLVGQKRGGRATKSRIWGAESPDLNAATNEMRARRRDGVEEYDADAEDWLRKWV